MIDTLVGSGIPRIGEFVEQEFAYAEDLISSFYQDKWKEKALETRSYRSGDYYRNIHRAPNALTLGETRIRDVISDIGYGEIIESIGWGPGNPPRFPAEKALDASDPDVEKILTDAAGRVIDRIENG